MTRDPERLFDRGDPNTRALLTAARQFQPPRRVRRKTLAALGLAGLVSASPVMASLAAAKLWIAAAVFAAGGAATYNHLRARPPEVVPRPRVEAARAPDRATEAAASAPPARVFPQAEVPRPASRRMVSSRAATERTIAAVPQAAVTPAPASALGEETRLLDDARRALRSGELGGAQHRLRVYRQQHPAGVLQPEADLLHIEMERAAGRPESVREAGEAFLRRHPNSLLRDRVRALIQ